MNIIRSERFYVSPARHSILLVESTSLTDVSLRLSKISILRAFADGTFFFQRIGSTKPFIDSIIVQSVTVAASLCAPSLARSFGRRTLLLSGFSVTTISMFVIALVNDLTKHDQSSAPGKVLVAMLCLYSAAYGSTIGNLSWVTAGEMPSNRLRSLTFGLAMSSGFFFAWLTVFTTPFFMLTRACATHRNAHPCFRSTSLL